ncbi:alpha/beta-hydrolase family protein [Acuticoccus sp. MNP-M23]|uniref:alpha/beta hydrolase n=1 Tax=Acuticoccus sp. MNP-M23 TaxID=3072793 RepID=UPI002814CD5D|nr:alpha/beta-hydrolase family protein [Acuticoccus sp. MNP-M23]WMS40942.1 alpha/beta-hydrolase family protein [Acuticoccus sp. MNP-M23]
MRAFGLAVLPLLLGLSFFAASLTPSLIPRGWLLQGILAGLVTGIGYVIGQILLTAWRAIDLPRFTGRRAVIAHALVAVPVVLQLGWSFWRAADWQDSIRERLALPPVEDLYIFYIIGAAILTFAVLFVLGWAAQKMFDTLRFRLYRVMPARTANVLGLLLAVLFIVLVTRDGVVRAAMNSMEASYAAAQELFADAPPAPDDPSLAGSAASVIDWGAMGQPGRNFVLDGPDAAVISAFSGRPAKEPIRVYVGLADADGPKSRAELALEELKRVGAFDRKVLVVASPTGTGWLDPGGHEPLEFMHDGDIATVAVQYSYLQSPFALVFETQSGLEQASATMQTIYEYWRTLPPDARPEFYLHGLSLGAWSSMYSFDMFRVINDPVQGALWTGPPFPSRLWNLANSERNPGSPYVLPIVGTGELVRFTSQFGGLERTPDPWGRLRIVFLQHASDAIVFYEPQSFWRAPEWMREPRAPDVSPLMRFIPVVTQFQLALDMALALGVPPGYGHNYAAEDYIGAWVAVTDPAGWTEADTARLKEWCGVEWGLGCRKE